MLEATLAGRFKIRRLVGRGGMSSVYLGWDHALERKVAIKVLAPEFVRHLEDRERFRREARIAASLFHPNIVPVYACEQQNGLTFVVMRYVAGPSLAARLESVGALPVDETVEILAALADALHSVHGIGVVHRDVKPDNILLDEVTGQPMLTDFGVATVATSEHSRSEVVKALGTAATSTPWAWSAIACSPGASRSAAAQPRASWLNTWPSSLPLSDTMPRTSPSRSPMSSTGAWQRSPPSAGQMQGPSVPPFSRHTTQPDASGGRWWHCLGGRVRR
jgi:serine/threonine protein kinase